MKWEAPNVKHPLWAPYSNSGVLNVGLLISKVWQFTCMTRYVLNSRVTLKSKAMQGHRFVKCVAGVNLNWLTGMFNRARIWSTTLVCATERIYGILLWHGDTPTQVITTGDRYYSTHSHLVCWPERVFPKTSRFLKVMHNILVLYQIVWEHNTVG